MREKKRPREVIVQKILDREEHAWTDLLFEGWLADLVEHSLPGAKRVHLIFEDKPSEIRKTVMHYNGKFYDIGAYACEVVARNDEIVAKVPDIPRVPGIPDDVKQKFVEADREFDRMIRQVASRIVEDLKAGHMTEWADAWILEGGRKRGRSLKLLQGLAHTTNRGAEPVGSAGERVRVDFAKGGP